MRDSDGLGAHLISSGRSPPHNSFFLLYPTVSLTSTLRELHRRRAMVPSCSDKRIKLEREPATSLSYAYPPSFERATMTPCSSPRARIELCNSNRLVLLPPQPHCRFLGRRPDHRPRLHRRRRPKLPSPPRRLLPGPPPLLPFPRLP
jgi:hypothetical protein